MTSAARASLGELGAIALITALMGAALWGFAYTNTLSEYDLYGVAIGIWHGAVSGQGLASPLHYYVWLCFGYITFLDLIAPSATLADEAALIRLMNVAGAVSTLCIPALCWLALRAPYGAGAAMAATVLFVASPIFLDIAGTAHPLLPALALFFLGAWLMNPAPRDWLGVLRWASAAFVLTLALLARFEVAFAFPFLVLLQPRTESLRAAFDYALRRCVPGVAAIAAYFMARNALLGSAMWSETGAFFEQWYSLSNLGKGVVAAALAAGVGLSVLAALSVGAHALTLIRAGRDGSAWISRAYLLAPLGVIGVALIFWLANPLPARHFVLFTFGLAVLAAASVTQRWPLAWPKAAALALAVSLFSQLATFATAPLVARLSPSDLQEPVGALVPAPAEPAWIRRQVLRARSERTRDLAAQVAARGCAARLVVVTDQSPAFIMAFLRRGRQPEIVLEGAYAGAFRYRVRDGAREVHFLQREGAGQPIDVTAAVLNDPAYAGAAIFVDPLTRRITDLAEAPPERRERFDCPRA